MSVRAISLRTARVTAILLLTLLLLAFALLQVKEHLLRKRNERLLSDFHSIRLNQTTWPEAQALMERWGKMGHARGPCSSMDCAYDITVIGWPSLVPDGGAGPWLDRLGRFPFVLRQLVGVRFSLLHLRFLVQDGAIRRTQLNIAAETVGYAGYMSEMLIYVRSRASISSSDEAMRTVGADEELGVHPNFVVGPESFCTGCETISLTFTPGIAPEELMRLTSFHLSCLTDNLPCIHLSGFAPAMMEEKAKYLREVPRNSVPCTTPAWALGRDADGIWLADTLSAGQVMDPDTIPGESPSIVEEDQIRLVKILKGPLKIAPQSVLRFRPYSGVEYEARAVPEHLKQGHRYILLPWAYDDDWQKKGVVAWRCGVLEDTPENELSIQQGVGLDDHLRGSELTEEWPW
jgi:hypothetical protein